MKLYLAQHGPAVDKSVNRDRPLSDIGRDEVAGVARYLRQSDAKIAYIFHSGKTRAEQTAEILADVLDAGDRLEKWEDGMAPKDDINTVKKKIERWDEDAVALVGHLPHLSRLASELLAGNQYRQVINFKNAGIVCLSDENDSWQLEWIVTPEIVV